jgi:hypothetical protein
VTVTVAAMILPTVTRASDRGSDGKLGQLGGSDGCSVPLLLPWKRQFKFDQYNTGKS